ncbi:DeoR/GlpR family transcriptional regulator [Streptomyces sp. A7024]|uniref:DeoR/GlpR family transcriptional regulator n=1 Tax=Streptomyces coryli TaxID=1128680 RepID=A0A6G4TZF7_9ACTN|nr:substrate-binding domain-containing protein [Streptomyces coryli]NGN64508.1 DeoR/GlpR family transcriptional regulator [Streptomyces coryli]
MREAADVRRRRILATVQARGEVRLTELASDLEVSIITVRRDVEDLTRDGKLRRGHGVARSVVPVQRAEPAAEPPGGTVGIVVPERHAYLYETMNGAREVLQAAGVRPALLIAPQAPGTERPIVERALADGVRGLLIAPRWRSYEAEEGDYDWLAAATADVPAVLMERRPRPGSVLHAMDSVCSDHWYGVHLAVDHLLRLGHRRIVLAARDDSPTARAVRAAFAAIAADRSGGETWDVIYSAPDAAPDYGPGTPVELAALLRERGATAAILHGDVDALMLVQQLADAGLKVPQDCSVVAYDDVVAALGNPPLTAVAPPKAEVGRMAAELLLRRLGRGGKDGGAPPAGRLELLPKLEVRGSTQAPMTV